MRRVAHKHPQCPLDAQGLAEGVIDLGAFAQDGPVEFLLDIEELLEGGRVDEGGEDVGGWEGTRG